MIENLTDEEMQMFEKVQTRAEWRAACTKVKDARDGRYPDDWWPRMKLTGKMDEIIKRFGGSTEVKVEVVQRG